MFPSLHGWYVIPRLVPMSFFFLRDRWRNVFGPATNQTAHAQRRNQYHSVLYRKFLGSPYSCCALAIIQINCGMMMMAFSTTDTHTQRRQMYHAVHKGFVPFGVPERNRCCQETHYFEERVARCQSVEEMSAREVDLETF